MLNIISFFYTKSYFTENFSYFINILCIFVKLN